MLKCFGFGKKYKEKFNQAQHRIIDLENEILEKNKFLDDSTRYQRAQMDTLYRLRLQNQVLRQRNIELEQRVAMYENPFSDVEKHFRGM